MTGPGARTRASPPRAADAPPPRVPKAARKVASDSGVPGCVTSNSEMLIAARRERASARHRPPTPPRRTRVGRTAQHTRPPAHRPAHRSAHYPTCPPLAWAALPSSPLAQGRPTREAGSTTVAATSSLARLYHAGVRRSHRHVMRIRLVCGCPDGSDGHDATAELRNRIPDPSPPHPPSKHLHPTGLRLDKQPTLGTVTGGETCGVRRAGCMGWGGGHRAGSRDASDEAAALPHEQRVPRSSSTAAEPPEHRPDRGLRYGLCATPERPAATRTILVWRHHQSRWRPGGARVTTGLGTCLATPPKVETARGSRTGGRGAQKPARQTRPILPPPRRATA